MQVDVKINIYENAIFNNGLLKNINYIDIGYKEFLLNDNGNKLLIEFDLYISPDSPIK